MWLNRLFGALAFATFLLATDASGQIATVGYDAFMEGDLDARIAAFQSITPDNRSEIVRTQIERWLSLHRSRLTQEQIAFLEEARAFATADAYSVPADASRLARTRALEARGSVLFTHEELSQALTINGPHIPKQ